MTPGPRPAGSGAARAGRQPGHKAEPSRRRRGAGTVPGLPAPPPPRAAGRDRGPAHLQSGHRRAASNQGSVPSTRATCTLGPAHERRRPATGDRRPARGGGTPGKRSHSRAPGPGDAAGSSLRLWLRLRGTESRRGKDTCAKRTVAPLRDQIHGAPPARGPRLPREPEVPPPPQEGAAATQPIRRKATPAGPLEGAARHLPPEAGRGRGSPPEATVPRSFRLAASGWAMRRPPEARVPSEGRGSEGSSGLGPSG